MNKLTEKEQKIAKIIRERLKPNNATLKEHTDILKKTGDVKTEEGSNFAKMDHANQIKMVASLNHTKGYCSGMKEAFNLMLQLMDMSDQEITDWMEEEAAMKAAEEKRMQDFMAKANKNKGLKK